MFSGNVQSPIEYYLTENKKELIRQTHLLLLWILLGKDKMKFLSTFYQDLLKIWKHISFYLLSKALITFFMTISRIELKTYMRRQSSFRNQVEM